MATFPSFTPTYVGFSKKSSPVKRLVRFADGYEHRVLFGLANHQNPKVYNLQFDVTEIESDVIEAFLDSRANDQASFTFTPPGEGISKTGTYSQSGTTVTITLANHGIAIGETVTLDYTSGSATDGTFIVGSSANQNTFTVTAASSGTNSGDVAVAVSGAKQFVCESWTKTIPYNNRAKISTTFREVFEP
tara:strand:- start:700 stop:1269 length:570 start_codon:yes stop_codon:yes gene_type:complete